MSTKRKHEEKSDNMRILESILSMGKKRFVAMVTGKLTVGIVCVTEEDFKHFRRILATNDIFLEKSDKDESSEGDFPSLHIFETMFKGKYKLYVAYLYTTECIPVFGQLVARFIVKCELITVGMIGCCIGREIGTLIHMKKAEQSDSLNNYDPRDGLFTMRTDTIQSFEMPAEMKRVQTIKPLNVLQGTVVSCHSIEDEVNWSLHKFNDVVAVDRYSFDFAHTCTLFEVNILFVTLGVMDIGHPLFTDEERAARQACMSNLPSNDLKREGESDSEFKERKMRAFAIQLASEYAISCLFNIRV